MNRIVAMAVLMLGVVLAYRAEVKKADISLLINDQPKQYHSGDMFDLKAGDLVCFSTGNGRVVIRGKNYKTQLSKHSKSCKHLPSEDGKSSKFISSLAKGVVSFFEKTEEKTVSGVSRKGNEQDTYTTLVILGRNAKYLAIENSSWGPLPVTLEIIDKNGKTVEKLVNEDQIFTSFVLPASSIKEGYRVKVTNAFGDLLVDSSIHIQSKEGEK